MLCDWLKMHSRETTHGMVSILLSLTGFKMNNQKNLHFEYEKVDKVMPSNTSEHCFQRNPLEICQALGFLV